MKKLLLLLLLSLTIIGSANADSTDAFVDKTYSITEKDGSAFCQYTIDILATEELLEQEFHTVNLDFDLTQNDGFMMQTYWSPDSKRSWIPIPDYVSPFIPFQDNPKYFVILKVHSDTMTVPILAWDNSLAFLEADGSSWIRTVLFIPQSC